MQEVIEVRDLTKTFGMTLAVNHVSFDVHQGEIFGFLGSNGAGKTTMVRMLTGVIPMNSGTASILGYDIQRHLRCSYQRNVAEELADRIDKNV